MSKSCALFPLPVRVDSPAFLISPLYRFYLSTLNCFLFIYRSSSRRSHQRRNPATCTHVSMWAAEICQTSLVVIKIAPKYPARLLKRAARSLAGRRSHGAVQSVAVPCLEPALSGACLPTASAAALSGSYNTH